MKRVDLKKNSLLLISIIGIIPVIILLGFGMIPWVNRTVFIFFALTVLVYGWGFIMLWEPLKVKKEIEEILLKINLESRFEEIDYEINDRPFLKTGFTQYKKSLRGINSIDESIGRNKTEYYSTLESEHFFNEGSLIHNNVSYKLLNFIPQVLTGLGIFGTFLGIVQGVSGLGEKMSGPDSHEAIQQLLNGVQVSFRSSLYGIAFSIALTIITKMVFDQTVSKINKLNTIIDKSLKKNIQQEGLKELEKQLEKQTSAIERLATDISEELGKKIDASLEQSMIKVSENIGEIATSLKNSLEGSFMNNLAPALERMSRVSEELGQMQQKSSDRFISDAIGKIDSILSTGTQKEMEKLKLSLENMSEKNNEFVAKFMGGMEKIEGLFSSQQELISRTNDSARSVNLTTDNMKELQEGLGKLLVDVNRLNHANDQSVNEIGSMFEKIKAFTADQANVTGTLAVMVDKAHEYSKMQENYMIRLQESTKSIDNSIGNSKKYIEAMTAELRSYLENFKTLKETSFDITENLNNNFADIINKLENSNYLLNESISRVNADIITNVDNVSKDIAFVSKELKEFYVKVDQLSNKFEGFSEVELSTQELWKNYQRTFNELNTSITDGVQNYTELIKRGTSEIFEEYDSQIADAVKHLKGMVESIHNELENVAVVFEDIIGQGRAVS